MRYSIRVLPLLLLALWVAAVPAAKSPPAIRVFEFHYRTRIPPVPPGAAKLRVWIPVPSSDAQQEVSGLRIESPAPNQLRQEREYGNRYAYLEVDAVRAKTPIEVRMEMKVRREENRVDPAASGVERKDPAEIARSLASDRRVPLDGMIAKLAAEQTRGLTRPLDKARAIYNHVVSTMKYDKTGEGWGRGDAIYACNARKGNCTDFHALLIGMMRASGIPARFEIGFSTPGDRRSGEIPGYHCWAQFWLEGAGWVPVDASEAWKNPGSREYFFGAHDQHRVLFSRGRDVRLDPPQQGEPLNYFVYPYAEVDGKPFQGVESRFSFRDLER